MVEKVITLESIQLIDFLGVGNENIKEIAAAFPDSKIISRGNEIKIQGSAPQIIKINEILGSLLVHFKKYGKITKENIQTYLTEDKNSIIDGQNQGVLLYGTKGSKIYPRTPNQKKLVESAKKNDLVFA